MRARKNGSMKSVSHKKRLLKMLLERLTKKKVKHYGRQKEAEEEQVKIIMDSCIRTVCALRMNGHCIENVPYLFRPSKENKKKYKLSQLRPSHKVTQAFSHTQDLCTFLQFFSLIFPFSPPSPPTFFLSSSFHESSILSYNFPFLLFKFSYDFSALAQ